MSNRHARRRLVATVAAGVCALVAVASTQGPSLAAGSESPKGPSTSPLMDIQLLSFNDFHGNLEPPSGSSARNTTGYALDSRTGLPVETGPSDGGVEYLATHLAKAREGHENSLTVAAGDIIGASPLLSAAFHDEPSIEAMNSLDLDVSAVGNHEFDEGFRELQRMQSGGCIDDGDGANNQNSCPDGSFAGAGFDFLAANVKYAGTDETILPAYTVKKFNGAKIGFIGMTLEATPNIVTASGVAGLEFTDEVETANKLVPVLEAQGVNAIVVLLHEGGTPAKVNWTDANGKVWEVNPTWDQTCSEGGAQLRGDSPVLPIARDLDPAIDMVVSGHTHAPYVCSVKDPAGQERLITSAASFGKLYTETNLTYDRRTSDIVRSSVEGSNVRVSRDVTKDASQTALIAKYKELVRPIASEVIGHINENVTRTQNAAGESQLGDLIADAQLADDSTVTGGQEPVIAFMNPGGIRTDLTFANSPYAEAPGDVTYEEAFSVQPFNNYLVSLTLTGAQINTILDQQVTGANAARPNILQVSNGFTYSYNSTGAIDDSVRLNGTLIDDDTDYRVVTNNFLADGGDGFPAFRGGRNVYFGGLDIDAFSEYLQSIPGGYTPGPLTRITKE